METAGKIKQDCHVQHQHYTFFSIGLNEMNSPMKFHVNIECGSERHTYQKGRVSELHTYQNGLYHKGLLFDTGTRIITICSEYTVEIFSSFRKIYKKENT